MAGEYRDPKPLAGAAIMATWAWLAVQSLYAVAALYSFMELSGLPGDTPMAFADPVPPEVEMSMNAVAIAALLHLLAFAVSGFLILRWIHRVNSNAQGWSSTMGVSPGWNVGFFFIPIANLFKPFQGVRETWEASQAGPDYLAPNWMRWWWAFWLATNILGNISFRIGMQAGTAGETAIGAAIDVVAGIVGIPLALLLIRLIRELTLAQESRQHGDTFA
jgi:hypothetical protein